MRRTKQLSVPLMTNQLSSKPDVRAFARVTCITLKWWRIDFPVISVRHVFSNQALLLLSGRLYDTGPPNASSAQNWPSPLIITWKNKQSGFGYSTGRLWSLLCAALPSAAGAWSTTPKCHITPSKEIDFFFQDFLPSPDVVEATKKTQLHNTHCRWPPALHACYSTKAFLSLRKFDLNYRPVPFQQLMLFVPRRPISAEPT